MAANGKPSRAVVTCMDYRIKEPVILNYMGWDKAYVIRNAGGVVTADVVRSLMLLQKFILGGQSRLDVVVVTHTGCGMLMPSDVGDNPWRNDIEHDIWIAETPPFALETFPTPELGVRRSVQRIRSSYFVSTAPTALTIAGGVYHVETDTMRKVTTHVVEPGETWYSVARRYGISEVDLRDANPQAPENIIAPGQVLYIPPVPV